MRLTAIIYLAFKELYKEQSAVTWTDRLDNAADMFRRESISVLGSAVNKICQKCGDDYSEACNVSITDQKSGLKISILNLLKLSSKSLIGHFLVQNCDDRSKRVIDFLQVLETLIMT